MIEKYKKFLLVFVGLLFCTSVIYTGGFIWANTLENGTSGFYFTKNFLLENTKDRPRIIFESGSNSQHSINSLMVERELGLLTLNLGYNGGYQLYLRLYRLTKHLHNKDIVILPLEYTYYARKDINLDTVILDELVSYGKFHFNALPFYKKLSVIAQMNLNQNFKLLKNTYRYIKHKLFGSSFNFDSKEKINDLLFSGERGDINYTILLNSGIDLSKQDDNVGLDCQEYISMFGDEINPGFTNDLKLLQKISKETGARFIFTYPALAGDGCYDFSSPKGEKLKALIEQIKPLVESYGFLFIGNPFDSYFPNNMLNTYWHIDEKARDIRTERLIEELKKTGFFNTNK